MSDILPQDMSTPSILQEIVNAMPGIMGGVDPVELAKSDPDGLRIMWLGAKSAIELYLNNELPAAGADA